MDTDMHVCRCARTPVSAPICLKLQEQPHPQREKEPGQGSFGEVVDCRTAAEEDDAIILLRM